MQTRYLAIGVVALVLGLAVYATFYAVTTVAQQMTPEMSDQVGRNATPPVKGLYKGKRIAFIHTESSDAKVAGMLTRMMGPKVLTVPSLAKIPKDLLADVYVFTNGVKGGGPFGFQPDVFDAVPGDPRYTPLRALTLVTWRTGSKPGLLGSVEEIQRAADRSEVALGRPGVVVNMPIVSWPGGHR